MAVAIETVSLHDTVTNRISRELERGESVWRSRPPRRRLLRACPCGRFALPATRRRVPPCSAKTRHALLAAVSEPIPSLICHCRTGE